MSEAEISAAVLSALGGLMTVCSDGQHPIGAHITVRIDGDQKPCTVVRVATAEDEAATRAVLGRLGVNFNPRPGHPYRYVAVFD